jgi:glycosyltransferase involved in cell wall biosynthesis
VVVPCYNEEAAIPHLAEALVRLERCLKGRCQVELIFVDDGSTDATRDALRRYFGNRPDCRILHHDTNRGIAAALATGFRAATHEVVASIDSDCTYDPVQLADMVPRLADGVAMVTASPYHPQGRVLNVPAWRLHISRAASWLYRRLLGNKLHTYTSCFRVCRRSAVVDQRLRHEGFVGVAELLWRVDRAGERIVEHPAVLDVRRFGQSKMRVLSAGMAHLRLLATIACCRIVDRFGPSERKPRTPDVPVAGKPAR